MPTKFPPFELDTPRGHVQGTLVCIPGLNSGAYMFTDAQAALPDWRIVRLATPGVNGVPLPLPFSIKAYARHVQQILSGLPVETGPLVVLGHSMGGYAAQELYRLLGTAIDRLVLVSTSRGQPDTARDLSQMEERLGQSFWDFSKALNTNPEQAMQPLFGAHWPVRNPTAYTQFLRNRMATLPESTISLAQLSAGGLFSSVRWAHKLTCPVLVLHGTEDILVSHASGRALAASLPQGRLLALHGVGHFPPLEHPNFWQYVCDFCEGTTLGDRVEPRSGWRQWLKDLWERQG